MFTCNVCGRSNPHTGKPLDREKASCSHCGSNVRTRGLLHALSLELFGVPLSLPEFPRVKSLRGLGLSDPNQYAVPLAEKFDYRNTFYDREPCFDITHPPAEELGRYDFIISSEVFEHVAPPAEAAFVNACSLLKPSGLLVFTVPYSTEATTVEHYPDLDRFGFATVDHHVLMVNRTRTGQLQVFENPVFHRGISGDALEMREFCEADLKAMLLASGFRQVHIHAGDDPRFGLVRAESWSLPVAARKQPFTLGPSATRDLVEEWRELNSKFRSEMARLNRSLWFRIGRRLGLL